MPQSPARQAPSVGAKLGLVGAGLLCAGLLLEGSLRLADSQRWVRDWERARTAHAASIWIPSDNPRLVYRHRPSYRKGGVRYTDVHGILRPEDASLQVPPGTFRIAVIGDSVGAAYTLPYEDRVFTMVERALDARADRPVEVLNFCVTGYSTAQEAELFEDTVVAFAPDLVLLQYCVNDLYPSEYPLRWFRQGIGPQSYAVTFVRNRVDRAVSRGFPPAEYWERLYATDRAGWQSVRRGFERVGAYGRAHDVPTVLVIFPALSQEGWLAGNARGRHAQVAALARETGFEVIDLLDVLGAHPVETLRLSPRDTFHLNASGYRIAAEAIAHGLLPVVRPDPD